VNAIEVDHLSLWYGDFQALRDVSVSFPQRQVTAVVGPSGCGKTTLLKTLNRMHERGGTARTEGQVRVHGHDVLAKRTSVQELRRRVGLVFQRPNPLPLSVYENIAFGARLHEAWPKARLDAAVRKALTRVGFDSLTGDRLSAPALEFSLEEQQRLCIARLLPLEPEVLLMDEPTSALDTKGTRVIEQLVQELRADYTVVLVTHSMAQARRISDRCVFMFMGERIEDGPTQELFAGAKDPRTRSYLQGRFG
jgi:phosphate transport system ATP-binding protein